MFNFFWQSMHVTSACILLFLASAKTGNTSWKYSHFNKKDVYNFRGWSLFDSFSVIYINVILTVFQSQIPSFITSVFKVYTISCPKGNNLITLCSMRDFTKKIKVIFLCKQMCIAELFIHKIGLTNEALVFPLVMGR